MSRPLVIERDGAAWTFVLSRADKRNALSAELVEALQDGVDAAHRAGAAVLVFRGDGRNFSAGFDFTDVEKQSEGDLLLRFVRIETLLQTVAASPSVTIAFAHGRNFGAGADLFAACRMRIATADATFRMPGRLFGLVLGTRRFAALVGSARAEAILDEAKSFDAAEALAIGFVERIAEAGDWPAVVAAAAMPRSVERQPLRNDHDDADLAALVRSAASPGIRERIARYLESS